jgi:hypothetical protein
MRDAVKWLCMVVVASCFTGVLPLLDVLALGDKDLKNAPFIALICIACFCVYLVLTSKSIRRFSIG